MTFKEFFNQNVPDAQASIYYLGLCFGFLVGFGFGAMLTKLIF